MDWQRAIDINRQALLTIVIALMKSLGLVKGGSLTTLPFHLYRKALLVIRPAEAALRRLIIIAAHDLKLRRKFGDSLLNSSNKVGRTPQFWQELSKLSPNLPSFNLIEPLKNFGAEAPDFSSFGEFSDSTDHATRIQAASLGQRLLALHHALNSIPKQARRLARWYAARDLASQQRQPHRFSPMRPGLPPGYKRRPKLEIEMILKECHGLARDTFARRDSS